MKYTINNKAETIALAKKFSKNILLPLIIGFSGDLGAGKTTFIRALIRTYCKNEKVKSPTFSLLEEYNFDGISIMHVDLYRINKREENYLDYKDYFTKNSLLLVEWIENDKKLMLKSDIIINIQNKEILNKRRIIFTGKSDTGKIIISKIYK